jgi:PTS system nitrogen regulatory IIA component
MYLNIIQLAESFGVEENVVESWVRNEALPAIKDRGRLVFDRAQVVAWAAERGRMAKAGFLAPTRLTPGPGRRLETLLRAGGLWRDVPAAGVLEVLERVVTQLPSVTPEVSKILGQRLRATGGINWAPVGHGLALPHLRSHVALGRDSGVLAILFLRESLPLAEATPDGEPISRLLFFIAPSPRAHLEMLAQLSSALTRGALRSLVLEQATDEQIFKALAAVGSLGATAAKEGLA